MASDSPGKRLLYPEAFRSFRQEGGFAIAMFATRGPLSKRKQCHNSMFNVHAQGRCAALSCSVLWSVVLGYSLCMYLNTAPDRRLLGVAKTSEYSAMTAPQSDAGASLWLAGFCRTSGAHEYFSATLVTAASKSA